ncbi:MAG: CopG family transcriptional regulator [Campylobacterota bacterium]|nr:CopG family transcriptional regulator [Campylobacterota bacterium]
MVATVRLNSEMEELLNSMSLKFHKKKSDVIRDALTFYAKSMKDTKDAKLLKAIEKTKDADYKEHKDMDNTLDDGL